MKCVQTTTGGEEFVVLADDLIRRFSGSDLRLSDVYGRALQEIRS